MDSVTQFALGAAVGHAVLGKHVGRRALVPLGRAVEARGELSHGLLAVVLMLYAMSAFVMDAVGIHAVFGGFLLGACLAIKHHQADHPIRMSQSTP